MDSRASLILFFFVAYLVFANDTATQLRGVDPRASLEHAVNEARRLLDIVGNASYSDATSVLRGANASDGFGLIGDYAWQSLPEIQAQVREHIARALDDGGQSIHDEQIRIDDSRLYMNITGDARGEWIRSPMTARITAPHLNISQYSQPGPFGVARHAQFERNFTRDRGHVSLGIRERELSKQNIQHAYLHGNITTIAADLVLSEDETEQEEEISLRGVYFPRYGHAVLTTTSSIFAGLFALPFFSPSEHTFDLARTLLNDTITKIIADQDPESMATISPWAAHLSEGIQQPRLAPKCQLIVYLQQIPAEEAPVLGSLATLDTELRYPTGAPLGDVPRMHFSMLAFSPDCGYVMESRGPPDYSARESDHLFGYKRESLQSRARHHMLLYGIVVLLQLIALLRQMRESNTPSTRSRVSFYTIAFMVFGDAFATIIFITISLYVESIWITIMSTAFFSLASMLLFGMRFLSDIWAVRAPERRRQEQEAIERLRQRRRDAFVNARQRLQSDYNASSEEQRADTNTEEAPAEQPAATPTPTPPAPVAVDFGSLPVFMPSDQAGLQTVDNITQETTFGTVYLRFSFLLVMTLFVSISAVTFPDTLRRLYFTAVTFAYLSFWLPQIWRNAWRNCRCALKWEFVAAQSVLRLLPVAYFFGWEGNVLFSESHLITLAILCVWVWLQVLVLVSQEIVGPRWLVKEVWVPPAWDYHPVLQKDVEGFSMPLGLSETDIASPTSPRVRRSSRSSDKPDDTNNSAGITNRVYDCAICMQELDVPIFDSSESQNTLSASYLLTRRTHMLTPCRHIFHTKCLEGWMKYRMQCPICREELPP